MIAFFSISALAASRFRRSFYSLSLACDLPAYIECKVFYIRFDCSKGRGVFGRVSFKGIWQDIEQEKEEREERGEREEREDREDREERGERKEREERREEERR